MIRPIADDARRELEETYEVLLARAKRRTGAIPEDLLVRHVLSVTRNADWPVRREALEALLRRETSRRRDGLVVDSRPRDRRVTGEYATRRKGASARPYRTVLRSLDPLIASCDCPDFLRGSLGLCKHILAVLDDLVKKPRQFARGLRESEESPVTSELTWDPVRPLTGDGDPLERIAWHPEASAPRPGESARSAQRWFRAQDDGRLVIDARRIADVERRLECVRDLLAYVRGRGGRSRTRDTALGRMLEHEADRLERLVERRVEQKAARSSLRTLSRKLYPYQREGVERFLATGRLLLADDMGLGKTVQAIACCHAMWSRGTVRRGLVIAPASLKSQWEREWLESSDAPVRIVDGGPDERAAAYRCTKSGFLIVNYEQVLRDLPIMQDWAPDMVVLDEAQRIKNWATKTSAGIKALRPEYRLVLTGTPMENRLEELASIVDWVDDFALEPKWRLVPFHTRYVDGEMKVDGARNLDTLRLRLSRCLLRRVRREVLGQLPERTDVRVPIAMTEEQREAHDDLYPSILGILQRAERRPLRHEEFLRLMQLFTTQRVIANGLAQLDFAEVWPTIADVRPTAARLRQLLSPKLFEIRELIERLVVEQGRKVVVFSQWRRMLQLASWSVSDVLAREGLRSVFFTGGEGQKRRTHNIVDFHDDPATRVFFASDAGGVGLNLQRAATCSIHLELPWNPAVLEQRVARIHRIGQVEPIENYFLVSDESIEARIEGAVGSKRALFEGLFDGTSDEVDFASSGAFLTRVQSLVHDEPLAASVASSSDADDADDATDESAEMEALLARADEARDETHDEARRETGRGESSGERKSAERTSSGASSSGALPGLTVERGEDGSVRVEVPPESADAFEGLLASMLELVRASKS